MEYRYDKLRETDVVLESTRRTMKANKCKDTSPELKFSKELWRLGLRGYRKHVRKLPGNPDIVFGRWKVAIQVFGCYWHGCPNCIGARIPKTNRIYWTAKFEANKARDERSKTELEAIGYLVVVVWECEIKKDVFAIAESIKALLAERRANLNAQKKPRSRSEIEA